jgi:hypothetical protein
MNSLSDLSMPKRFVSPRVLFVILTFCFAITGCGGSGPKLYSVKGKVTLDGSDLKAGTVAFIPDQARGNKVTKGPVGKINSDGTYTVATDGKDGAPLGFYKVTVNTEMPGMNAGPIDPSKPPTLPSGGGDINKRFTSAETTSLSVEVVATPQPGQYDLKVTR